MPIRFAALFILGFLSFVLFQNCSARHESWEQASLSSINEVNAQLSLQSYEANLYPIISQNCAACHGVSQQPLHALPDSASAHDITLSFGLVNFIDPSQSRLVTKISGGHSGLPNALSSEIQAAIEAWASDRGGSNNPDQLTPTFSSINRLILQPKCVSCHNPSGIRTVEDYTDYVTTINTGKIVPFDALNSTFFTECASGSMPQSSTPLNAAELGALRTWIDNGALND